MCDRSKRLLNCQKDLILTRLEDDLKSGIKRHKGNQGVVSKMKFWEELASEVNKINPASNKNGPQIERVYMENYYMYYNLI